MKKATQRLETVPLRATHLKPHTSLQGQHHSYPCCSISTSVRSGGGKPSLPLMPEGLFVYRAFPDTIR